MRVRLLQSILVVTTLSLAGSASAHFELKSPTPSKASDTSGGKGGRPCGPDTASAVITPVTGGSMIELKIDETTFHPGHYRVALVKSRDELHGANETPTATQLKEPDVMNGQGMVITSGNSATAVIQNPPKYPVIADNVFPHTDKGGERTTMIAIPNINCDKCTLQVIQFMAQHGPDYFYRHCADLKITADPGKPIFDPTGMGGSGGGGAGGAAGSGGAAGGSGGAAAGSGGSSSAGTSTGGTLSTAGSSSGGAPGTAGTTSTAGTGTGTAGSAGVTPPANAEDDGGCSVARVGDERASFAALAASLLLGLGWFARRRNRPE